MTGNCYKLTSTVNDLFIQRFSQIKTLEAGNREVILLEGNPSLLASKNGTVISDDAVVDLAFSSTLGMVVLKNGNKYGLYDIAEDSYVLPSYDELYLNESHSRRALVVKNNLYGVIDSQGNDVIGVSKVRVWFDSNSDKFIVQEKANSKKRYVYSASGGLLYDYKE